MTSDIGSDSEAAVALCRAAHGRLLESVRPLADERLRSPSRRPGWSLAHVVTHLARNADGHTHRLEGALQGEDRPRYPGGTAQRDADIAAGAGRLAREIGEDLEVAQGRLEQTWERCRDAGWPNPELVGEDGWPTTGSPARRLREVAIHHVDMGVGYETSEWPDAYVEWDLPVLLATVPGRLGDPGDARAMLAWLAGRAPLPTRLELKPW